MLTHLISPSSSPTLLTSLHPINNPLLYNRHSPSLILPPPITTSFLVRYKEHLIIPLTIFTINNPPFSFIFPPRLSSKPKTIETVIIVHKARFDDLSFHQIIRSHVDGLCKCNPIVYFFQKSGSIADSFRRVDRSLRRRIGQTVCHGFYITKYHEFWHFKEINLVHI